MAGNEATQQIYIVGCKGVVQLVGLVLDSPGLVPLRLSLHCSMQKQSVRYNFYIYFGPREHIKDENMFQSQTLVHQNGGQI